jgi:subtilisin-like proprotein convertase family protein
LINYTTVNQRLHKLTKVSSGDWTQLLLMMAMWLLLPPGVKSQCSITDATSIPDNDFITLGFNVSGLTNANLASPAQGICGVDISFNHEYLGDLTITLISPSGTSVQLVGPTTNATLPTNLSTWNVHFVPCGSPANPDFGFTDTWSNLQDWATLTTYTGSYYPASGCLEDFNIGSANGQWLIIVQDHDPFQIGNILSITLLFCDPTGLLCSECIPNGGMLSPASFNRCAGENIQSSEITVNYGNNIPSPLNYGYQYLLTSGNIILQSGISFSFNLPAGSYSLCGLSYLLDDSTNVNALLATGDLSGLQQDILSGAICGKFSGNCVPIEIADPPDTTVITGNLCQGESFSFGGQTYFTTGTFYQVHGTGGMCDSVFEIRLTPRPLNVVIAEPDTLFCNNPMVVLSALVGGANGPFSYNWATSFGNITSSPTLPSITVDQAGPYTVAVTDGLCSGSASTNVVAGPGFPQIFVNGGTITCKHPVVDLNPVYIPSNGTVLWTGPLGFTSNQANINVNVPGVYQLTITNTMGCATAKDITVSLDTMTTPIGIYELPRYCLSGQGQFGVATALPITTYNWSGPNNYSANVYNPVITDPGLYTVVAIFANGCQSSASYFFDADFTIPDITVPSNDTINCNETLTLTASSTTPGTSLYWQLPNLSFILQPTIQVQQSGIYVGAVTSSNSCFNSATVEIVQGPDVFPYQIFYDTLDCAHTNVTIGVLAPDADLFQWLNYVGPDSDQPSINVSNSGTYTVMMTDTNSQCELVASIFVPSNFSSPDFGFITDTISCSHPSAQLSFVPFNGNSYSNVFWELPDFSIVQGPILMSDLPGNYFLTAIAPNGCENVKTVTVPGDTLSPFLLIEGDTIACYDTATIIVQPVDSVVAFNWSGPAILSDLGSILEVTHAGIYTLQAIGENGCATITDILVDSNYTLPVFSLVTDTLRCDRPATLSAISNDSILQYHWYDPSGILLAADSSVDVVQPGIYTFDIQGANRCFDYDTVILAPVTYPVVQTTSDTLTCQDRSATIQATFDVQPAAVVWLDMNGDTLGMNSQVVVHDGGPFTVEVTGPNGCMTRDTIMVPYDSLSPHANIALVGEVRCKMRDVTFDGSGSTPANITFSWSTIGGQILSDPTLPEMDARDTGLYQLIVMGLQNGCMDTAVYHLLASPDEITEAQFLVSQPKCSGQLNGSILLEGITGGISPFLYQVNGGPPQINPLFDQLSSGQYTFTIQDDAGCVYDTVVNILNTVHYMVDAGPDLEIYIGESILLTGATDLVDTAIANQVWDSLNIGLCQDCPDFEVSPQETTTYSFQVTSSTGCMVEDEMTVFVLEKGNFFLPNVFSPNGDNINDEIRIFPGSGIQRVLQWVIFDRWGDAVYGKTNFDPDDPSVFWDGRTTTGDFSNPGVFPYVLEIQLINGNVELLHGNITLIR